MMNRSEIARYARALRERLEGHRLAGWEPPLAAERIAPDLPAHTDHVQASPVTSSAPAETPRESGSSEKTLELLRGEVAGCSRCRLHEGRAQAVFGVGDPNARLMFVGEGPGSEEDRQGEPFVGPAGQLLDKIIVAMGLRRADVYIANVVKCRPPNNRNPRSDEMEACRGYLDQQIGRVAPEVIVALGTVAARALVGGELSMGKMRGRFHHYGEVPVMPTYHPAYLLRTPSEKRKVWEDIQQVMARLELGPDESPRSA